MYSEIIDKFLIYGDFIKAERFGNGHINDTFLVTFNQAGIDTKYILRKVNKYVFTSPKNVIENTINVIKDISIKIQNEGDANLTTKVQTLIKTRNNSYHFVDENKDFWMMTLFLEDSFTVDYVRTTRQAYLAAREFGKFQKYLLDTDVKKYKAAIKDFHSPSKRLQKLENIVKEDSKRRASNSVQEIDKIFSYQYLLKRFPNNLPVRITHNDTKINNILFDRRTKNTLCIIDLDTVMPGTVIYDFGDMIRTMTSPVAEDEKEISKVYMRFKYFEAIIKGYLEILGNHLVPIEIDNLILGAQLIIYEQSIRFLSDYLAGDQYYHIHYKKHNLVRARNQLALLESVNSQETQMIKLLNEYLSKLKVNTK